MTYEVLRYQESDGVFVCVTDDGLPRMIDLDAMHSNPLDDPESLVGKVIEIEDNDLCPAIWLADNFRVVGVAKPKDPSPAAS